MKARKKLALNARIDRMVESLDALRQHPRTVRGRQTRHTTASSVGTSESELSRSPLDAYTHLREGGRLRRDFTIINGSSSTQADDGLDPIESVRAFIFQFSVIMIGLSSSPIGYSAKSCFATSARLALQDFLDARTYKPIAMVVATRCPGRCSAIDTTRTLERLWRSRSRAHFLFSYSYRGRLPAR